MNTHTVSYVVTCNKHTFITEIFYEALHELLSEALDNKNNNNLKIDVVTHPQGKKHQMVLDTLSLSDLYVITSKNRNTNYNLYIDSQLHDMCIYYNGGNTPYDFLYEKMLFSLISSNVVENKQKNTTSNKKQEEKKEHKQELNIVEDTHKTINEIYDLVKKIDTEPIIEKVLFPEEKIAELNKEIKRMEDLTELENEIKKMEELKDTLDEKLDDLEKVVDEEQENLSKFHCLLRNDENELKREKERLQEEYSIFTSEKNNTYPIIFNHFFVKKIIGSWEEIPCLFLAKFPVYLYLDGKGTDGNPRHTRYLDTDDEFRLYKLLFDSMLDEDFEFPEDEEDIKIVNDFINTYPLKEVYTIKDVMSALNNPDDELFEQDETSQCSAEEDDDQLNTYEKTSQLR